MKGNIIWILRFRFLKENITIHCTKSCSYNEKFMQKQEKDKEKEKDPLLRTPF
jgi:hypothetical protein